jgi:FtsP/CotA-like multicopper oxidase with cupredoxin domain
MAMAVTAQMTGWGAVAARVESRAPVNVAATAPRIGGIPTTGEAAVSSMTANSPMAASTPWEAMAMPDQAPAGAVPRGPDTGPGSGRPESFLPGTPRGDGTRFAEYKVAADGAKEFTLVAAEATWEIAPGQVKRAFAFNGMIPGPTIRVNEGDKLRIFVKNDLPEPTAVHWHGMVLPNKQDGVPGITQNAIPPGGTYTYEYTAVSTGTHWYHSHIDGDQVGKGLFGSLEIVPHTGDRAVDRDFRLFVGDTNLGLVINGKSFPYTTPMPAQVGDKVKIRITATGELVHPFHLHGQPFQVIAQDGFDLPAPVTMDTLLISTAQTFDIITTMLEPGRWVFHCHIFSHMHAPGGTSHDGMMTGLVSVIDVTPAGRPVPPVAAFPAPPMPEIPGPPAPPPPDQGGVPGAPAPPAPPKTGS